MVPEVDAAELKETHPGYTTACWDIAPLLVVAAVERSAALAPVELAALAALVAAAKFVAAAAAAVGTVDRDERLGVNIEAPIEFLVEVDDIAVGMSRLHTDA